MNKIILSLLTIVLINSSAGFSLAWNLFGSDAPLLTINETSYQIDDYINWWHEWRESAELPQTADTYIDWLLLATEAQQMQLQDRQSYQDKVSTFLKVRSLMLLKKEEIDDKTTRADDAELHKIYLQDYAPRWQLRTISFKEHADLNMFLAAQANAPDSSSEEILASIAVDEKARILSSLVWQRPNNLPAQILTLLQQTKNSRFSAPYPWNNTWQIIEVIATEPASDADFAKLRANIADKNFKEQQAALTAKLMHQLREKYAVKIDQELLATIDNTGVADDQAQKVILELLDHKITAEQLYTAAKRQFDSYGSKQNQQAAFQRVLNQVLNGIISQNLTNIEALARNYQLRPPLKATFDFYCKHRLIRELEQQLIVPAADISEEQIKQAYQEHKQQFTGPSSVKIMRAETTDAQLAAQLREKMRQGEDFASIIALLGHQQPQVEQVALAHLSLPLQQQLKKMQKGEADMVTEDGTFTFVQLIQKEHQQNIALEEIKSALSTQLKQQAMQKKRQEIIQQLRQRSSIELNPQQWQKCLDQLKKEN
ncbi:MAG: peptidylprolyl isomerase [Desulfuromonas sp.]|nr:peptidylprolyl isomerase [Desulfuromonas sp.]